jgi:hypothetical protein
MSKEDHILKYCGLVLQQTSFGWVGGWRGKTQYIAKGQTRFSLRVLVLSSRRMNLPLTEMGNSWEK